MTKQNKQTYIAVGVFFLILVFIGTSDKATIDNNNIGEHVVIGEQFIIPELPVLAGDPVLTAANLPALVALPELTGIVSPTEDSLPHLTLPPLEG